MRRQGSHGVDIDPPLARQLLQECERRVGAQPRPVGSVLHHGLEDVGHPQDPRLQRHRLGGQVEGVAAAIGLLVVIGGPQGNLLEAVDVAQNLIGFKAVGVDDGPLPLIEFSRLVEDLVGYPQLAEIVQQPGDLQLLAASLLNPHPLGQPPGQPGHPEGVGHGEGALGIDDGREDARQLLELAVAGEAGLPLAQHAAHVVGDGAPLQLQPECLRQGGPQKGRHQLGGEELAGARLDPLPDLLGVHQQGAVPIMRGRQGIDPVHQKDEVGLAPHRGRHPLLPNKLMPVGVVIADGLR